MQSLTFFRHFQNYILINTLVSLALVSIFWSTCRIPGDMKLGLNIGIGVLLRVKFQKPQICLPVYKKKVKQSGLLPYNWEYSVLIETMFTLNHI